MKENRGMQIAEKTNDQKCKDRLIFCTCILKGIMSDLEHVILSNDRDPFVVIVLHKYVRPPPPPNTHAKPPKNKKPNKISSLCVRNCIIYI